MLLALDTSTSLASIALASPDRLLAELTWEIGQRHSTDLFERLRWLLSSSGIEPRALNGIAVATGPGSFNGLRVALTTAKTLAYSLAVPLYGHSTLDVIAWGHATAGMPIWALIEAGRGQLYSACYMPAATALGWGPRAGEEGYTIVAPAELAAQVDGHALLAGELRPETSALLAEALHERAHFAVSLASRRASWLAELALARAQIGAADDPMQLEPLYLRKPAITQSKKGSMGMARHVKAPHSPVQTADTVPTSNTYGLQGAPRADAVPDGEGVGRAIPH